MGSLRCTGTEGGRCGTRKEEEGDPNGDEKGKRKMKEIRSRMRKERGRGSRGT